MSKLLSPSKLEDIKRWFCCEDVADLLSHIEALESRLAAAQNRIDAAIVTALRYESLHDLDPKRGAAWGEHKMALMVDAAITRLESEKAALEAKLDYREKQLQAQQGYAAKIHRLFHEATEKSPWELAMHGPDERTPEMMERIIGAWKAAEGKVKIAKERGEFLGVAKLAEKAWCMGPEETAALVMNMSSRALSWLQVNAPEDYAALAAEVEALRIENEALKASRDS